MFNQLYSWDNLYLAYRKASRGKRGMPCVASFEFRLEDNLLRLQREILEKAYCPGGYESFHIHDPKRRLISAAPFRDRVVHHALCNLIEPVFERSFIFDSYANRIGKGTHRALDRATQFARRFQYVLPCDVRQFFPSIDHTILRGILRSKIHDLDVLWLIDQILASGVGVLSEEYTLVYFAGDDLFSANRPRGLPIGNLTSQFWANCYLNPFDYFVKRELGCKGYLRYVDDFLLFGNDKQELIGWRAALMEKLAGLRLSLHENSAWPHPVSAGFPFLGFILFPTHRRLKQRRGIAFARRLRRVQKEYAGHLIPFERLDASITGWVNHVRYGDTWGLRRALLGRLHK